MHNIIFAVVFISIKPIRLKLEDNKSINQSRFNEHELKKTLEKTRHTKNISDEIWNLMNLKRKEYDDEEYEKKKRNYWPGRFWVFL